jgi:hypothetical protein
VFICGLFGYTFIGITTNLHLIINETSHAFHSVISIIIIINNYVTRGRAMAQAVSRRPLTPEAGARSRVSICEICGGQSGTGTGVSPSCRFSPVNFIPLVFH